MLVPGLNAHPLQLLNKRFCPPPPPPLPLQLNDAGALEAARQQRQLDIRARLAAATAATMGAGRVAEDASGGGGAGGQQAAAAAASDYYTAEEMAKVGRVGVGSGRGGGG